jgi:hypothetical protein
MSQPQPPYQFPFHTCERVRPDGPIAQPASFAINLLTCGLLLGAAVGLAQTWSVRLLLASYAAFEGWHAASHAVHVPGPFQYNVVHVLGIAMATCTLVAVLALSGRGGGGLQPWQWTALALAFAADAALYWTLRHTLVSVATGLGVLVAVFVVCWPLLPPPFRRWLPWMVLGVAGILALFVVEARYCRRAWMQRLLRAGVPFHAAIEVVGLVLFAGLAALFLGWEQNLTGT